MKIKSVTKSINIKVNTGNYGNFDIFSSMTADIEEGETLASALSNLNSILVEDIKMQKKEMDELDSNVFVRK